MLSRHDISDEHWDRIRHLLPGQAGGHGGVGNDTRLFLDAIRYLAKTGIAWADLPTCFGKPNSLWQRYNRWCERGVWAKVAAALRDDDTEWLSVDSTCVRANVAAAGAKKKPTAPAARRPRRWAAAKAEVVLADKGYDSDANRAAIRRRGAEPCIPARKNRKEPIAYDRHLYRERNVIERFFGRIKQYRRVATRFDKKAENYLGFAWLAAINIMLA
jgi:transposase